MITLITGAPGTGKTAALVSLLSDLAADRSIYSNGIPDLGVDHVELKDPTQWPDVVPDGSTIVIDEVQRIWRPRGPGQKVPPDIAMLETHRHRGLDFYVITQAPRLVDANVRALVGRHVHLRDLGVIGRWWYEWPECAENCATGWKTAPIKKRYRLPKAIFAKYKSASLHVKPIRSFPVVLVIMLVALVAAGYFAWSAYGIVTSKISNPVAGPAAPAGPGAPLPTSAPARPGGQDSDGGEGADSGPGRGFIDDRVDFIPRVSHVPESAPAYDHLRKIVNMPVVSGWVCGKRKCRCVTQQGTDAGLSEGECKRFTQAVPFDVYTPQGARSAPRQADPPAAPLEGVKPPLSTQASPQRPPESYRVVSSR